MDCLRASVLFDSRRRSCHRRHTGCCIRLGTCPPVDSHRRYLLRCRHGLRSALRKREERRQIHGPPHREIHRQDRKEALPRLLLAVLPHRHRRIRRYGRRHIQRLCGRGWHEDARGRSRDKRRSRQHLDILHHIRRRRRPHPEEGEAYRLEGSRARPGLHRPVIHLRHEPADPLGQAVMGALRLRLHLRRSGTADVAPDAAKGLHVDIHVRRHDPGSGARPYLRAPDDEPHAVHRIQQPAARDPVPDSLRHGSVRRGIRLPQPGIIGHVIEDRFQ